MEGGGNGAVNAGNNTDMGTYVGAALTVAAGVVKVAMWYFGAGDNQAGKMMNAPGKPGVKILREVFEKDPSSYFKSLRKN